MKRESVDEASAVPVAVLLDSTTGYARVTTFMGERVADDLHAALDRLERAGMKRLVLDLRDNGGGSVAEAAHVAGEFLPRGAIVYSASGRKAEITDTGRAELRRLLHSFWTPPGRVARPVDLALQFVAELPAAEVEQLLQERLQALENQASIVNPAFVPADEPLHVQNRVADLFDHERRLLAAEREWCEHVLARVRAGAYAPKKGAQK